MENPTHSQVATQGTALQFLKQQEVEKLAKHLQILQKTYDDAIASIESFHGDNFPLIASSILLALRNQVASLLLINRAEDQHTQIMSDSRAIKTDIKNLKNLLKRLVELDAVHSPGLSRSQSDPTPHIKQAKKAHDRRLHLALIRLCGRNCRKNLSLKRIDAVQVLCDITVVETHLQFRHEEQRVKIMEDYFLSTVLADGAFTRLRSMAQSVMGI
ncbi:hypothetical protein GLAREA_12460 [Glarea lozoyensis ATCC 20868]|uniref:Uncharacterized protein n=1 Tax=Glarea lozoyensis (strain ATCC 20868 / MF5171) TaxID=1116229 RepID=S3D3H3_GLAL2|nr:uncharacterized protein GLAREA_12460 [Glarea lozoyensis ATCC 20868]EPE31704.1 hypothetical protein GLAREA_12460 [Glarea lozoyensis ATCC 20868]